MQPVDGENEPGESQSETDRDVAGSEDKIGPVRDRQQAPAESRHESHLVRCLDNHAGLLTAVATVVIAGLTISLACNSARQAEIALGTLRTIEGQLAEMRSSSAQVERSIEVAVASAQASRDSAKIARDQLTLAFPPKLYVINPFMHPTSGPSDLVTLASDEELEGEITFLLTGRDAVTITAVACQFTWTDRPLPMFRTYNSPQVTNAMTNWCVGPYWLVNVANPNLRGQMIEQPFKMVPGDVFRMKFAFKVPVGAADEKQKLYIIGWTGFDDPLTKNRYSLFARRYDAHLGRFVIVKNPDYQRESESDLGQDGGE